MRTFSGRLWLVKDRYSEVEAEVLLDLDQERLRITSNETLIGDWSFDELDVARDAEEIRLTVEGEELVVVSGDVWFAPTLEQVFAPSKRQRIVREATDDDTTSPETGTDHASEDPAGGSRRRGAHRRRGSFKLKW